MIRTYRDIQYKLKRSDRKTASIYVERDGQITLIAPEDLSERQIETVLEGKSLEAATTPPQRDELVLDRTQTAKLLKVSGSTVSRMVRNRQMPEPIRFGQGHPHASLSELWKTHAAKKEGRDDCIVDFCRRSVTAVAIHQAQL